jgi:hypothetical protein
MRGRAQGCTLPVPIGSTASVNGVTGLREAVGFVSVQPSHSCINEKALCMRRDVHHKWLAALGRAPTGSSWAIAVSLLRRLIRPPRSHIAEGWQLYGTKKARYRGESFKAYSVLFARTGEVRTLQSKHPPNASTRFPRTSRPLSSMRGRCAHPSSSLLLLLRWLVMPDHSAALAIAAATRAGMFSGCFLEWFTGIRDEVNGVTMMFS